MRFAILGPLEVVADGRQLPLGGPQQRALLAVLLLNAGRVVSTDRLVESLWGDEPPSSARSLLQGCVAGLRRAVPGAPRPPPAAPAPRVRLEGHPDQLGPGTLERLVGAARRPGITPVRRGQ